MEAPARPEFDVESSTHYFKSKFARMMALESRSLDYTALRQAVPVGDLAASREIPDNTCRRDADADVVLLRKECQCLLEENRRLRSTAGCAVLQQQLDTLHWQLRQNEASRKMHRQVLEQVAKFLDHAHRTLLHSREDDVNRVTRSHSVLHQDYTAYQDYTWRRTKKSRPAGGEAQDKLAKEAFRLLRTVQSLLGTCDPDLASRGEPNIAEEEDTMFQPLMASSLLDSRPGPSASSASSNEDESGFSSMGSFQEVGLPPPTPLHVLWV